MKSEIETNSMWNDIENGQTIGTTGSEGGKIVYDIENVNGARITLEKECGDIPFAITLGVYGLMFHTHFESDLNAAKEYITRKKDEINKVFALYDIPEEKRDESWICNHDELIDELSDITNIQTEINNKPAANSGFMKWLGLGFFRKRQ